MSNVVRLINPTLDEGQSGNVRNLEIAIIRGLIRKMIEGPDGRPVRRKAEMIATKYSMCAATVIKFAYGETSTPSTWTNNSMAQEAGFKLVLIPIDTPLPVGSHLLR